MKTDLIVIEEKPIIPEEWDYNNSVQKVKLFIYKWKNLTEEIVKELWIANQILMAQGARTDLKPTQTWESYCREIQLDKSTVNRWFKKYFGAKSSKLKTPELPEGKFNVIYADIPWQYDIDLSKGATRSPERNYPVMDLDTICEFGKEIKKISADDCILFMWITAPKLNWMMTVLDAFDFEYKTNFIWDKVKPNMGHYSSVRHEILIIAGKGKCAPLCDGKTIQSIDSVQAIEKSSRHSEKPLEFIEIIEKLYPNQKYIELFARNQNKREGWSYWGDEAI